MRAALRRKAVLLVSTPVMSVTPRRTTRRAQLLRKTPSEAEKRLWGSLRDRRLKDCKFVRQAPLGPYFADFLCRERKLIVEVDGVTHGDDHQLAHDAHRTRYLESLGLPGAARLEHRGPHQSGRRADDDPDGPGHSCRHRPLKRPALIRPSATFSHLRREKDRLILPFSRLREKVPEGRMRAALRRKAAAVTAASARSSR